METTLEQKQCKVCTKTLCKNNTSGFCKPCFLESNNPMKKVDIAKKTSLSISGDKNHMFGKHPTIETRNKMSFSHSGEKNHMFGKRFFGEDNPNYKNGKPKCACGKELHYGHTQCIDCYTSDFYGENNPNWKDGVTLIGRRIRNFKVYKYWYQACLERDNYTCQRCGSNEKLEVHHIIPVRKIIKDNNIRNSKEALNVPEFWMLELGITYCFTCHCIVDQARWFLNKRSKNGKNR